MNLAVLRLIRIRFSAAEYAKIFWPLSKQFVGCQFAMISSCQDVNSAVAGVENRRLRHPQRLEGRTIDHGGHIKPVIALTTG